MNQPTYWVYRLSDDRVGALLRRSAGGTVERFNRPAQSWIAVDGTSLSRAIEHGELTYDQVSEQMADRWIADDSVKVERLF